MMKKKKKKIPLHHCNVLYLARPAKYSKATASKQVYSDE